MIDINDFTFNGLDARHFPIPTCGFLVRSGPAGVFYVGGGERKFHRGVNRTAIRWRFLVGMASAVEMFSSMRMTEVFAKR